MTTPTLATALTSCAASLYPLEAGSPLLIAEGTFLHREDFTSGFIKHGASGGTPIAPSTGTPRSPPSTPASLPCSAGERRILAAAASIAAGIRVDLRDTATGLDARNIRLLITAISHAAGQRPR